MYGCVYAMQPVSIDVGTADGNTATVNAPNVMAAGMLEKRQKVILNSIIKYDTIYNLCVMRRENKIEYAQRTSERKREAEATSEWGTSERGKERYINKGKQAGGI